MDNAPNLNICQLFDTTTNSGHLDFADFAYIRSFIYFLRKIFDISLKYSIQKNNNICYTSINVLLYNILNSI